MLLENINKNWWGSNQQRKLQINKNYTPSYFPGYGEFENICFISVAWTVIVLRTFVYSVVDVL